MHDVQEKRPAPATVDTTHDGTATLTKSGMRSSYFVSNLTISGKQPESDKPVWFCDTCFNRDSDICKLCRFEKQEA